jgi:uncharacterized membrane protein (DUF373 family)
VANHGNVKIKIPATVRPNDQVTFSANGCPWSGIFDVLGLACPRRVSRAEEVIVPDAKEEEPRARAVAASVWLLEHAQDLVSVIVGMVLIVLAGAELVSGVVSFFADMKKISIEPAGINLLDRVLLVLILVEIVHTVVLSLRAHHLVAQPFIIVGLVAVIRRILVVLSGTGTVPTPQLALLVAMIFVFVAALLAVTWFDRRSKDGGPDLSEQEIS